MAQPELNIPVSARVVQEYLASLGLDFNEQKSELLVKKCAEQILLGQRNASAEVRKFIELHGQEISTNYSHEVLARALGHQNKHELSATEKKRVKSSDHQIEVLSAKKKSIVARKEASEKFNVVVFHDRDTCRELRHFVDGDIWLRDDPDREMLYQNLCVEVEAQIGEGKVSGMTNDPCYPEWHLTFIRP